nr:hypothetical protein BgiMline_034665 [Biomphalaria glabrata]KAI8743530.1 hypothetical protein BgiMline_021939 [Biomphalaria glabrata]
MTLSAFCHDASQSILYTSFICSDFVHNLLGLLTRQQNYKIAYIPVNKLYIFKILYHNCNYRIIRMFSSDSVSLLAMFSGMGDLMYKTKASASSFVRPPHMVICCFLNYP